MMKKIVFYRVVIQALFCIQVSAFPIVPGQNQVDQLGEMQVTQKPGEEKHNKKTRKKLWLWLIPGTIISAWLIKKMLENLSVSSQVSNTVSRTNQDDPLPHTSKNVRVYVGEAPEIYPEDPTYFQSSLLEENDFFLVGVTSEQGRRKKHEDAEFIALKDGVGFFAVCDGHGGTLAARYTVNTLKEKALHNQLFSSDILKDPTVKLPHVIKEIDQGFLKLYEKYVSPDDDRRKTTETDECRKHTQAEARRFEVMARGGIWDESGSVKASESEIAEVQREAAAAYKSFILVDNRIKTKQYSSGTTIVGACVQTISQDKEASLALFNLGDSCAVVYDKEGKVKQVTKDHKPDDKLEKARITKAGGTIDNNGRLLSYDGYSKAAFSRAIGDAPFKEVSHKGDNTPKADLISSDCDVYTQVVDGTQLTLGYEDFIVLACDGLWDVVEKEAVGQFVREHLKSGKSLKQISDALVEAAIKKESIAKRPSFDNVTVMIVMRKKPSVT